MLDWGHRNFHGTHACNWSWLNRQDLRFNDNGIEWWRIIELHAIHTPHWRHWLKIFDEIRSQNTEYSIFILLAVRSSVRSHSRNFHQFLCTLSVSWKLLCGGACAFTALSLSWLLCKPHSIRAMSIASSATDSKRNVCVNLGLGQCCLRVCTKWRLFHRGARCIFNIRPAFVWCYVSVCVVTCHLCIQEKRRREKNFNLPITTQREYWFSSQFA